jgi:hypothetical protein
MSSIKRVLQAVLLPALVSLVTGCQHAMPTEVAATRTTVLARPIYAAQGTAHLQKAVFTKDVVGVPVTTVAAASAAEATNLATTTKSDAPKAPDSLTMQLGDCLLGMLKLSTGR